MITTKMTNEDIDFIVKDIMQYKLGLEELQLLDSVNFQDDLGIDSLDLVELQTELEKRFDIKITDEESEKMNTVKSILVCVRGKME